MGYICTDCKRAFRHALLDTGNEMLCNDCLVRRMKRLKKSKPKRRRNDKRTNTDKAKIK